MTDLSAPEIWAHKVNEPDTSGQYPDPEAIRQERIAELEREIARCDKAMSSGTPGTVIYDNAWNRKMVLHAELSRLRNDEPGDDGWRKDRADAPTDRPVLIRMPSAWGGYWITTARHVHDPDAGESRFPNSYWALLHYNGDRLLNMFYGSSDLEWCKLTPSAPSPSPEPQDVRETLDGARPIPFNRDAGGRFVREAWIRWAQTQPNPKRSWLVPYDELAESDKEADRQIAEAVARWTLIYDAAALAQSSAQPVGWTCFHCGEHFDNIKCAQTHFGMDESRDPGCVEKLKGSDLGLLRRVRELEEQLVPYLSETSAVENYVHGLKADHSRALIQAEQEGYDKGLRDGKEDTAPPRPDASGLIEAADICRGIHDAHFTSASPSELLLLIKAESDIRSRAADSSAPRSEKEGG